MLKKTKFGEAIRKIRESRGQSIRQFAADCSYSPVYISDLENGNRKVTIKVIENICDKLELSDSVKDELFNLYIYDRLVISPDIIQYIIENNLIESIGIIKELDKDGNSIKELAKNMKNNKYKR